MIYILLVHNESLLEMQVSDVITFARNILHRQQKRRKNMSRDAKTSSQPLLDEGTSWKLACEVAGPDAVGNQLTWRETHFHILISAPWSLCVCSSLPLLTVLVKYCAEIQ